MNTLFYFGKEGTIILAVVANRYGAVGEIKTSDAMRFQLLKQPVPILLIPAKAVDIDIKVAARPCFQHGMTPQCIK